MLYMSYIHAMNISALNLNLLPVLDALLSERSVSRAGARLGLSQPAVSNALAHLRKLLGDPLRSALLALAQGLEPPAAFEPATAARGFTIATNDFVAFAVLPGLLARL